MHTNFELNPTKNIPLSRFYAYENYLLSMNGKIHTKMIHDISLNSIYDLQLYILSSI